MKTKKSFEILQAYGPLLSAQSYSLGRDVRMVLILEDRILSTKEGADLNALSSQDVHYSPMPSWLKGRGQIGAAVVFQTPYCMQWLKTGQPLLPCLDDMAQIIGPAAKILKAPQLPSNAEPFDSYLGDAAFGSLLSKAFKINSGCFVMTGKDALGQIDGFGLTVGRSLYEAIVAMTVLEKSAQVTCLANSIGTPHTIPTWERYYMRYIYMQKYSKAETSVKLSEMIPTASSVDSTVCENALEKQYDEKELFLRQSLVDYGKALVSSGLVQGTWGNLSARLNRDEMLTTPSGLDYTRLTPQDMVKVNLHSLSCESSQKPTSEKGLHAAIYKKRQDVNAIIHTHATFASVYAAAHKPLPLNGQNISLAKYALPGTKALTKNTVLAVGDHIGALMANHGMIGCGDCLETAFKNCKKIEAAAKQSIK